MKKILLSIFILLIISIVACQKAVQKEVEKAPEAPKVETTGEAAVDAVGNDLNNVNSIEKDLSDDELSDLDSGLTDIQNI